MLLCKCTHYAFWLSITYLKSIKVGQCTLIGLKQLIVFLGVSLQDHAVTATLCIDGKNGDPVASIGNQAS